MKKEEIQAIKRQHPIEEVVGRSVRLRRQGRVYMGLCPFHADRNPSFCVDPGKQTFVCYGCGAKGDVFAFIQQQENCTFPEALCRLGGTPSTPAGSGGGRPIATGGKPSVPADCSPFLALLLPYVPDHPDLSSTYLDFEVGQSPVVLTKEWRMMVNRLVFPIRNEEGELVAFAARRLSDTESGSPKYINSPTGSRYKKRETLYGLHRAKSAIRERDCVFVVEGYKDVLAMHAAGFTNTVGLCGTALTAEQVALVRKYTGRWFLLLDSDPPGQAAARKHRAMLLGEGQEVENLCLPEGDDPDSLFRRLGAAGFRKSLKGLLDRPPAAESLLVLACLLYPYRLCLWKTNCYSLVNQVDYVLQTERLPFEAEAHRAILQQLLQGVPEEHFPEELWLAADQLRRTYQEAVEQQVDGLYASDGGGFPSDGPYLPGNGRSRRDELLGAYLCRLILQYMEVRILRQLRRLAYRLHHTGQPKERSNLLIGISDRRTLLREVSLGLGRPGAAAAGSRV